MAQWRSGDVCRLPAIWSGFDSHSSCGLSWLLMLVLVQDFKIQEFGFPKS